MSRIGVMLCGHGSRSEAAVDEFAVLARKLPALLPPEWMVDYGYLEFANPVIRAGLDNLRKAGCERILAVPGMLFAAMHAKNDIPSVLRAYAAEHGIPVDYGRDLGVDARRITHWLQGTRPVPSGVWSDLQKIAMQRLTDVQDAAAGLL